MELSRLSVKELKEKLERAQDLRTQREKYEQTHQIEFFEPFTDPRDGDRPQQRLLDLFNAGKKVILYQGSNRAGKTTAGTCIVIACCLGFYPWNKQLTPFGEKPKGGIGPEGKGVIVRILCEDWEHHAKMVIVPKLKKWAPVGTYVTKMNNVGVEAFWEWENGSTIEIMTNSQETRMHESWAGHMIWADEPPSRDKYVAGTRGLIDFSGVFLLTMTATRETWVFDDICNNSDAKFGRVTGVDIRANPHLSEDNIKTFEAGLTEDEKSARVQGKWLNLIGLVWKEFDVDKHVIEPFKVNKDWPVVAMIDYHTSLPHAVSYYAIDEHEIWYLIDETFKHQAPEELAADIIARKQNPNGPWRIEKAFIDPLAKGDTRYVKMRGIAIADSFSVLQRQLSLADIHLDVATKDKQSGIINVERMLKGPNGLPAVYFFRSTADQIRHDNHGEGTIWEMQHWVYKDGEAFKENDHFCENLYRLTLTGVRYSVPYKWRAKSPDDDYHPLTWGFKVN